MLRRARLCEDERAEWWSGPRGEGPTFIESPAVPGRNVTIRHVPLIPLIKTHPSQPPLLCSFSAHVPLSVQMSFSGSRRASPCN